MCCAYWVSEASDKIASCPRHVTDYASKTRTASCQHGCNVHDVGHNLNSAEPSMNLDVDSHIEPLPSLSYQFAP